MTLAHQKENGPVALAARRTLNMRSGLDLDSDTTDALAEMGQMASPDYFFDSYSNNMALNGLQRYSADKDSRTFKIVDPMTESQNWESESYLEGVILSVVPHRAMRQSSIYIPNQPNPILCVSGTGETGSFRKEDSFPEYHGIFQPSGNCFACGYAEWPTEREKAGGVRSPRCPDRLRIFLKVESMFQPAFIDVPGSFRRAIEAYDKHLKQRMLRMWEVVSVLSVELDSKGYSYIKFEEVGMVDTTREDVVNSISAMQNICWMLCQDAQEHHMRTGSHYDENGSVVEGQTKPPPEQQQQPYYSGEYRAPRERETQTIGPGDTADVRTIVGQGRAIPDENTLPWGNNPNPDAEPQPRRPEAQAPAQTEQRQLSPAEAARARINKNRG